MSPDDDHDLDRWLGALSGRNSAADRREQVVIGALREALADEPKWSDRDRDGLAALLVRLRGDGLLAATGHARGRPGDVGSRPRHGHRRSFVLRAVGALCVAVLVVGGTFWFTRPATVPVVASDGFIDVAVVPASNPQATAERIQQSLSGFGIASLRAKQGSDITLDFDVPDAGWRRVADWAKAWRLDCTGPGRYRFVVRATS